MVKLRDKRLLPENPRGYKLVSGFEFSQKQKFNKRAKEILTRVSMCGVCRFSCDDGLDDYNTLKQLQAVDKEYFDVLCMGNQHEWVVVSHAAPRA
jgi:hypothetical protein